MDEPKDNIVDKIYKLRKNFVVIGLTGRTGSGCSTVAKLLSTQNPEEFKSEYREVNSNPIDNDVRKIELSIGIFSRIGVLLLLLKLVILYFIMLCCRLSMISLIHWQNVRMMQIVKENCPIMIPNVLTRF